MKKGELYRVVKNNIAFPIPDSIHVYLRRIKGPYGNTLVVLYDYKGDRRDVARFNWANFTAHFDKVKGENNERQHHDSR